MRGITILLGISEGQIHEDQRVGIAGTQEAEGTVHMKAERKKRGGRESVSNDKKWQRGTRAPGASWDSEWKCPWE